MQLENQIAPRGEKKIKKRLLMMVVIKIIQRSTKRPVHNNAQNGLAIGILHMHGCRVYAKTGQNMKGFLQQFRVNARLPQAIKLTLKLTWRHVRCIRSNTIPLKEISATIKLQIVGPSKINNWGGGRGLIFIYSYSYILVHRL